MIVNYQKPIEFRNESGCKVDVEELEKSVIWYSEKPVSRIKKIFMHGQYPAISIYKEKIHVHRLLMMYWNDRELNREEYVHHKDGNKLNALKSNLEIMPESEHQSLHTKGRRLSKEHRKRISEANKKRKGIKMRKKHNIPIDELRTHLKNGKSINWIAKHFGVDWSTIKSRVDENPELLEHNNE